VTVKDAVSLPLIADLPWYQQLIVRFWRWQYARAVRRGKWFWKCYRDQGGGLLETPKPMTKEKAMKWLVEFTGGEIEYVDDEYHFVFYRSRRP
jgi:hypothetical protein